MTYVVKVMTLSDLQQASAVSLIIHKKLLTIKVSEYFTTLCEKSNLDRKEV